MPIFELFCICGTGRAKGLGGPVAPADNKAEAEGDGGGRTTGTSVPVRRSAGTASAAVRGDVAVSASPVSAALLPVSDCSSGIVTFNRGLDPPPALDCMLLERDGGVKVVSGMTDTELRPFGPFVMPPCVFDR